MKGLIFTSFLQFAEEQFGFDFVDEMLDTVELSTGGAYTNVGTYRSQELFDMIEFIRRRKDADVAAMARALGRYTFQVLVDRYRQMVSDFSDSFDCIYQVDQVIHKNVLKLYPDAELPDMNARINEAGNELVLRYHSSRPLMFLAHGLLEGCVSHYGDSVDIEMTDLSDGAGTDAVFVLTRQ